MRKFLAFLTAALLCASPVQAQVGFGGIFPGPGTPASSGGGGYTGPGDIKTYSAWFGLRAYNGATATAGSAAINLCNGVTCSDVHVTSSGGLSSSDLVTLGCSAISTCTIHTFYDQTGNGNTQTQATAGSRPTFNPSCIGSLPCAVNNGSDFFNPSGSLTSSQPISMVWVGERTSNFTTQGNPLETSPGGIQVGYNTSANTLIGYFGSVQSATASDSTWHVLQMLGNGVSGKITVDNTTATKSMGTDTLSSAQIYLMGGDTGRAPTMNFLEGGMIFGDYSTATSTTCGNANTYWSISVTC